MRRSDGHKALARNTAAAAVGCAAALLTQLMIRPLHAVTQEPQETVWNRVYTEDQAGRGEQIYRQRCTLCHRDGLQGNSVDGGPPLRGPVFTTAWTNLRVSALVKTVHKLMPADQPGTLSLQQVVDVVTFILWANGVPAGTVELPADPAVLDRILFTERPSR